MFIAPYEMIVNYSNLHFQISKAHKFYRRHLQCLTSMQLAKNHTATDVMGRNRARNKKTKKKNCKNFCHFL